MSGAIDRSYKELLGEIKQRVYKAQYDALKAVNKELIALYWDIGKLIVARQKAHGWGKAIVENLAKDLQLEFPGIGGFSQGNLWRMRSFYETYRGHPKLAPLVREISWSHNVVIMEKYGDIEWKKLAGLRDKIIHFYFGVNWDIVWDVIKNRLPELKKQIESLLKI